MGLPPIQSVIQPVTIGTMLNWKRKNIGLNFVVCEQGLIDTVLTKARFIDDSTFIYNWWLFAFSGHHCSSRFGTRWRTNTSASARLHTTLFCWRTFCKDKDASYCNESTRRKYCYYIRWNIMDEFGKSQSNLFTLRRKQEHFWNDNRANSRLDWRYLEMEYNFIMHLHNFLESLPTFLF